MKYNLNDYVKVVHGLSAAALSATSTTSSVIDTAGFSEALVIVNAGVAASSAEADVTVLESPSTTTASFAHIAGASFTQITPTAATLATQIMALDLTKRKRYLQIKNKGDGSNLVTLSVNVILGRANVLPVTQTVTEKTRI